MKKMMLMILMLLMVTGCTASRERVVSDIYAAPDLEAQWIRNGLPIEYNDTLWYPVDDIESFTDTEMLKIGEHNGVSFFIDRVDIKPYSRLYTKFGRNKFRYFEPRR